MANLRRGQRFTLGQQTWRVAYVNASRAHCVCVTKRVVQVVNARTGVVRTFKATVPGTMDISPNSEIGVLAALGWRS